MFGIRLTEQRIGTEQRSQVCRLPARRVGLRLLPSSVRSSAQIESMANTFYAYNNGQSGNSSFAGIYKSADGGANWSKVHSGVFSSYGIGNFNATLKCVPGQAGHLFYTGGAYGSPLSSADRLVRSTDGGATWTNVKNILASTFGFGKAAPGQSYPAIYVVGFLSGAYGIYRSIDNATSWTKIGDYPLGSFDLIRTIEGDANSYGKVYIGFQGSGFAYGIFD